MNDLSDSSERRSVQNDGLDISGGPQTIAVKQMTGTGYVWFTQVTPSDCVSITETDLKVKTVGQLNPGAPKSVHYQISEKNMKSGCKVNMALARPWLFSGFDSHG